MAGEIPSTAWAGARALVTSASSTMDTSFSMSKGLVRYSRAPACSALTASFTLP